jgi:protein-S-isoprenylcysteine O-methyltransferase Ste14
MTIELKILLFTLATIAIIWVSRSSLRDVLHHGFYRFFSWEIILILFLLNIDYWFVDPFAPTKIISWFFLIISLVLIIQGVQSFRKRGVIDQDRNDPRLVGVEKTTKLVTSGIYHYIRHPFYSSLLFLGWGIVFKNITLVGLILALINSILLVLTARREEIENIHFFGEKYREYMKQTKMFVPYIF